MNTDAKYILMTDLIKVKNSSLSRSKIHLSVIYKTVDNNDF